MSINIEKNCVP